MRTIALTREEFEAIAAREENHFFDFKSSKIDGRGIQKIVVALANADGGEFIIGIKDGQESNLIAKRWDGFPDIEAMNSALQAIFDVKPAASVNYDIMTCDIGDGYIIRVTVEKSSEVLSTSDHRVILRHGAQSITIKDPERIQQLAFSKSPTEN